jgi:hypothetical protein
MPGVGPPALAILIRASSHQVGDALALGVSESLGRGAKLPLLGQTLKRQVDYTGLP